MQKLLFFIGTRPEYIKLAPVIVACQARPADFVVEVCITGQHRELLALVQDDFAIAVQHQLAVMQPNQSLAGLTARLIQQCDAVIGQTQPDWIIAQGDTTTTWVAGLAAFYRGVKVAHVEAGLRTADKQHPFPEELNRRLMGVVADLNFAPTAWAANNLAQEHVPASQIMTTGNTVVDALQTLQARWAAHGPQRLDAAVAQLMTQYPDQLALVTCHRRESFGAPLQQICAALRQLAQEYPALQLVYPVHLNPNVHGVVHQALAGVPNIHLLPPLDYESLLYLLQASRLVLTDSGGIQEEAPSFGVPVLVLRERTERPEAVDAGFAQVVGRDQAKIVSAARALLVSDTRPMLRARANPFGDGQAAVRIAAALAAAAAPLPQHSRG